MPGALSRAQTRDLLVAQGWRRREHSQCRRLENPSALHGTPDANVFETHGIDRGWVVLKHCEIGMLARFDRADLAIEFQRVSSPQCECIKRFRLTAHHAVNSGPSGVIGASEWMAIGTPLANAVRHAFIRSARSGPTVRL